MVSLAAASGARPAPRLAPRRASRRRPGRSGAPSHDARRDRLELRAARSGSAAPLRPGGDLPEQVHARGGERRRRARGRPVLRSTRWWRRASSVASARGTACSRSSASTGSSFLSRRSGTRPARRILRRAGRSARRPSSAVRSREPGSSGSKAFTTISAAPSTGSASNASRSCGFAWLRRSDASGTSAGISARGCNGSPRPSRGRRLPTRR